jgi:hypothetical protein
MTEEEWLTCNEPQTMLAFVEGTCVGLTLVND